MTGPIVLGLRILMTVALYGFLIWALIFVWRDINHQGWQLTSRSVPGIQLTLSRKNEPEFTQLYSQPEIMIGRDKGCDIQLKDDTVSARHTQLTYHHGQWWIADLSSRNGTFLNGSQVQTPTVLAGGDLIKCGTIQLMVDLPSLKKPSSSRRDEA